MIKFSRPLRYRVQIYICIYMLYHFGVGIDGLSVESADIVQYAVADGTMNVWNLNIYTSVDSGKSRNIHM